MSCDVGEVTGSLENEQSSLSKLPVTSPTSQLILQSFRRFTYVTAHSPTLPLLHLHHSSFSSPSFACPKSQALHLRHLANRPCFQPSPATVKRMTLVTMYMWRSGFKSLCRLKTNISMTIVMLECTL